MSKVKVCMVIAVSLLVCACSGGNKQEGFRRGVYLTHPTQVSGDVVKSYPGIIEAAHEINLGFKTAGQISRIHVKEGDYVRRGQLLATLDDADYRLAVEASQVRYDQLADETQRTEQLFKAKSVSANDYEKASAGLKQLGVQLRADKNKLAYTRLYAPTDGYVQSVNFSPAEMVDAGTSVFRIMDVSRFEVAADIPVDEYLRRKDFVRFCCRAVDDVRYMPMRLLSLTPKADGNQLYRMRLAFADAGAARHLTAGMNIEAQFTIAVSDTAGVAACTLPMHAVFNDGGQDFVWVVEADSAVRRTAVTLGGIADGGTVVVTDGISTGDRVVRAGVEYLQDDEKVNILPAQAETNVGDIL